MTVLMHEGLAHWVGVVMAGKVNGKRYQSAWYPRCMVDTYPRGQLVRIALDAPPAPFITCMYCMTK